MVAQLWWNHSLHALHWAKLPREVSWRSQGRRHWQYTATFWTFFTLLLPNLLGVADRVNGNISPSSKQLAKCSRIFFWSKDRLWGSTLSPRAVANAMANTLQLSLPSCTWTSINRTSSCFDTWQVMQLASKELLMLMNNEVRCHKHQLHQEGSWWLKGKPSVHDWCVPSEQSLPGLHIDEAFVLVLLCDGDQIAIDLLASAKWNKHSFAYLSATYGSK